jgi:hypothetical protein
VKYHDGPFIKASPSDIAGLVIVIFFASFFFAPLLGHFYIPALAAAEFSAIIIWFYRQKREEKQVTSLFGEDEEQSKEEPPARFEAAKDLADVILRFFLVLGAVLAILLIAMIFIDLESSPILRWSILGAFATPGLIWLARKFKQNFRLK